MAEPLIASIDTSPIIALHAADALSFLPAIFAEMLVLAVVWEELTAKPDAAEPAVLRALPRVSLELRLHPIPEPAEDLDAGEQHAIALALARSAVVIIDERRGRAVAAGLGLTVRGTLGVLGESKRIGLVDRIRPRIERMIASGIYLAAAARAVGAGAGRRGLNRQRRRQRDAARRNGDAFLRSSGARQPGSVSQVLPRQLPAA